MPPGGRDLACGRVSGASYRAGRRFRKCSFFRAAIRLVPDCQRLTLRRTSSKSSGALHTKHLAPKAQRLRDMDDVNIRAPVKVGDGARKAQRPVIAARR